MSRYMLMYPSKSVKRGDIIMRKFVMECPSCGKYVEASTGFFAKKRIVCVCVVIELM